jgi:hypothetical protein
MSKYMYFALRIHVHANIASIQSPTHPSIQVTEDLMFAQSLKPQE